MTKIILKSDKIKMYQKLYQLEYNNNPKRKEYLKIYSQTENRKLSQKKYHQSEKAKKLRKIYEKSETRKSWKKTPKARLIQLIGRINRRERLNNCIHSFTKDEWRNKCDNTNGICPECNKPFDDGLHKLTLDHIFAVYWANEYFKQTGKKIIYTIGDVQPLCLSCNCSKNDGFEKPKGLNTSVSEN